jgi:nitroreductase
MEFLELAKSRYSSRKYKSQSIEKEKLELVLEAGRIAPSASNKQPWYFIVVDEPELLQNIKSCYQKDWIQSAPCVIVILGDHNLSWKRDDGKDHCDVDISIAIDHMTLAATNIGLSTCWICKFDAKKTSEIFNLPSHIEPIALLPIGYPEDQTNTNRHDRLRKPLHEIVFWNEFNK